MRLPALLRAMRPHQWTKNVFVLAALGFSYGDRSSGPVTKDDLIHTALAFVAFCLGSSAVYLLNDVMDVEKDRLHPEKRLRPIAAGEVSIAGALAMAGLLVLGSLALAWRAGGGSGAVAGVTATYVLINLGYSLGLKKVVLVDAFCIATGFLLRVLAGGFAAGTEISHWMLLCTLFLALFLALNKRRAELALLGDGSGSHRATLRQYSVGYLDQLVTVLAACTILCYTMYTVDEETASKFGAENQLVWSVPFVVFGIARYMFLVQTERGGDNPTRIFLGADPLFTLNIVLWLVVVAATVLGGA